MNSISLRTPRLDAFSAFVATIGAASVLVLAGCASGPSSRVVSAPPPDSAPAPAAQQTVIVPTAQVQTAPAQVQTAPAAVIVQQAPPVVRQESMPERPSDRHVWVAGYWGWQRDQYVWVPGQWVIAPRDGATWVPPRWEREGSGYRFYDGYWAD